MGQQSQVLSEEEINNEKTVLDNEKLLFDISTTSSSSSGAFSSTKLVKRVVTLSAKGMPLVYARSYWPFEKYQEVMKDKTSAIGYNMTKAKLEYFREIKAIRLVRWEDKLDQLNGEQKRDNFARGYFICKDGQPMTYIEEFFTAQLDAWMKKPII